MYWADHGTDKIQRANLELGEGEATRTIEDLVTGLANPEGIALDISRGKMYWADRGTNKIQRADLDGSNIEDLITTGLTTPVSIVLDFGTMAANSAAFYVEENVTRVGTVVANDIDSEVSVSYAIVGGADQNLFAIDSDTGALTFTTAPNFEHPVDDGGNNDYGVVVGATRGTGDQAQMVEKTITVIALDILGGKMYWMCRPATATDKIQRANLELGEGEATRTIEDLVTGLANPEGIALDIWHRRQDVLGSKGQTKMYWTMVQIRFSVRTLSLERAKPLALLRTSLRD